MHTKKEKGAPINETEWKTQKYPELLIVGHQNRVREIEQHIKEMRVIRRPLAWPLDSKLGVSKNTIGIILVAPLSNRSRVSLAEATTALRQRKSSASIPIIAIIANHVPEEDIKNIYDAKASAVFKWSMESEDFSMIVAEILGMAQTRGLSRGADAALGRTVRAHLKSKNIHTSNIEIEVRDSAVTMAGSVQSLWHKEKIKKVVENIPGITQVLINAMYVPHTGLSDHQVHRSVKQMLKATGSIEESTFATQVQNGTVILSGTAIDTQEYRRILDLLTHVKGVRNIEKYAVISWNRKQQDQKLASQVRKTLAISFPKQRLDLRVFGGTVVLSGQTETVAKQRKIVEAAELQNDVGQIVNKIRVTQKESRPMDISTTGS